MGLTTSPLAASNQWCNFTNSFRLGHAAEQYHCIFQVSDLHHGIKQGRDQQDYRQSLDAAHNFEARK